MNSSGKGAIGCRSALSRCKILVTSQLRRNVPRPTCAGDDSKLASNVSMYVSFADPLSEPLVKPEPSTDGSLESAVTALAATDRH